MSGRKARGYGNHGSENVKKKPGWSGGGCGPFAGGSGTRAGRSRWRSPRTTAIARWMKPLVLILSWLMLGAFTAPGEGPKPDRAPDGGKKKETPEPPAVPPKPAPAPEEGKGEPSKVFRKKLNLIIQARWSPSVRAQSDAVQPGTAEIRLVLDAQGRLVSTRLVSNTSNAAFSKLCEKAVSDAAKDFPAVPEELLDAKTRTFEDTFSFTVY
jgi:hypothetical protein